MYRNKKSTETDNRFVTAKGHRSKVKDAYKCDQGLPEGD